MGRGRRMECGGGKWMDMQRRGRDGTVHTRHMTLQTAQHCGFCSQLEWCTAVADTRLLTKMHEISNYSNVSIMHS